jgi:lipoprotein NlpD
VVRKGETLYSIAFRYGQEYRELAQRNGLREPYQIYPGQKLALQGSVVAPAAPAASPKQAPVVATAPAPRTLPVPPQRTLPPPGQAPRADPVKPVVSPLPVPGSTGPSGAPRVTERNDPATHTTSGIRWQWPVKGQISRPATSSGRVGVDIIGRDGQPVKAAAPGEVVYSGDGLIGYGKLIIIKHNDTFLSAYAHNRALMVREGLKVAAGQQIAEMGSSGADQVKLYFEIRRNGKPVSPLDYLP